MRDVITVTAQDGIAFIGLDHPPSNALTPLVRKAILEKFDEAEQDESIRAIVLFGQGKTFSTGLSLSEYTSGLQEPRLSDVCARVESCEKPVVAALNGAVLGGGVELALACHYRVADKNTELGMLDVNLGLTPSAGGSQRLARAVGAEHAMSILLGGQILSVRDAPCKELIDGISAGNLLKTAARFAQDLLAGGAKVRRLGEVVRVLKNPPGFYKEMERRRAQIPSWAGPAIDRILQLIEAAFVLPFPAGLAMEEDAFDTCLRDPTSIGLRHALRVERRALRDAESHQNEEPDIETVAVLGSGPLSVPLILACLKSGLEVFWGSVSNEHQAKAEPQIAEYLAAMVRQNEVSLELAEKWLRKLEVTTGQNAVDSADFILRVEKGQTSLEFPDDTVQAAVFPGWVEVLGLRFVSPAHSTRLVEIVQGPLGSEFESAHAFALARKLDKVPMLVQSTGETVASRMTGTVHKAADALLDLGLSPYEIDKAISQWGWSRVPFLSRDFVGLARYARKSRREGAPNWSRILFNAHRTGRESGRGFYDWHGSDAKVSAAALRLVAASQPPTAPKGLDIPLLIVGAMALEGARMVQSGMVTSADYVDLSVLTAMDFPKFRGGPMKIASTVGLLKLQKMMTDLNHPDTDFWSAPEIWRDHVKNGRTFDIEST